MKVEKMSSGSVHIILETPKEIHGALIRYYMPIEIFERLWLIKDPNKEPYVDDGDIKEFNHLLKNYNNAIGKEDRAFIYNQLEDIITK